MKPAVFQISGPDGSVRLIICHLNSLEAAVNLENELRKICDSREDVTLLGRFHRIQMATSPEETIALVLNYREAAREEGLTVVRSRRDVR
jgi:hypothetical protein